MADLNTVAQAVSPAYAAARTIAQNPTTADNVARTISPAYAAARNVAEDPKGALAAADKLAQQVSPGYAAAKSVAADPQSALNKADQVAASISPAYAGIKAVQSSDAFQRVKGAVAQKANEIYEGASYFGKELMKDGGREVSLQILRSIKG